MVDPTAAVVLPSVESSLHSNVQTLLKEMNSQSAPQKGRLRWSLHKKLEGDPSRSDSLIRELVKELEKKLKGVSQMNKRQSYMHVIPVLHTLYYVVIQSGAMIPTSLYQVVYECLIKLLILPLPYSAVALSTLRSIKVEMITPGSLYQMRVIAEQNLKNEHFTLQEKVFVLADPAVFSVRLEATIRAYLEVSSSLRNTPAMEKNVVLRVLQTALGTMNGQSSRLAQSLDALEDHMIEKYFQEVVLAVEQSIKHGAGGHANYLSKLQDIYRDILTASKEEITKLDHGTVCGPAMPFPEINFLMWKYEEDLYFALGCCPNSGVDGKVKNKRHSVESEYSGTETDLKESDFDDGEQTPVRNPGPAFNRRNAFKNIKPADKLSLMREKIEAFPGSFPVLKEDRRRHTARVVVMGDDRVLGRLSRAYHSIREKESKCLILTKKLNLQLYYIPVTDVEPSLSLPDSPRQKEGRRSLASLLGTVDPWYNSNINSLEAEISKLARMHSNHSEPSQNLFLLDTLCYYLRCGTQPVNLPIYSVKMTCSSCDVTSVVEDVFVSHLEADIPEFRHLKEKSSKEPSARRKKSTVEVLGAVISVSYTKTSLSKREVVNGEAPMTYGVVITSEPATVTSGEDYLSVRFDSVNPGYNTTIQTRNISIKTFEHRTLSVCLDKDSCRTYTDVQRIEISPCLDPGCNIRSRSGVSSKQELPLSKYLNKVLSLPINTFTGVNL
ncbi:phosphoinositide 3-kinase regulatory subunit 6 isoform X2 [Dicentrarchus labrax]|uniref:phosphoinositide 3-kinase regulatory subunit 6 isoform X2 n=1 Tax=Dicentrarchus labrax TaxID=13489 RepID=UPI0021F5EBB0|nr:phosphoinositide 3-kinase regulatory subunit 6 isoform X2 [Dicentrarchus labrax]